MTQYITIDETVDTLAEIGVSMKLSQLKRAAEPDAAGRRKLPFFKDPIDGRLKIEKGTLVSIYSALSIDALKTCSINFDADTI